jgi:hypothetical protein
MMIPPILIAWIAVGTIRVLLGSSTTPIAYAFFGVFWLISLILLTAAIRQLFVSKGPEHKIESICICAGLLSFFSEGLLGQGSQTPIAALVFLISAVVLLLVYSRRLWMHHFSHP